MEVRRGMDPVPLHERVILMTDSVANNLYKTLPESLQILSAAGINCAVSYSAWQKLEHARKYLDAQISELISEKKAGA